MFVPIQHIVDAHTVAGFTLEEDDDESCITFRNGEDICFHSIYARLSRAESEFVVEDDRRWNADLADTLETYFNSLEDGSA